MAKKKTHSLNCWRLLKRKMRKSIGWSDWPLKSQIMVQISMFAAVFFIFYFTFNIAFTSYELKRRVLELLNPQL